VISEQMLRPVASAVVVRLLAGNRFERYRINYERQWFLDWHYGYVLKNYFFETGL